MDEVELYEAFDEAPTPIIEFLCWLVRTHHVQEPLSVLDVGCGLGRMFAPLSKMGWHVTGLEPNDAFYEHAKGVAEQFEGVLVKQGGFNDISGEEKYDLICGINSSFAHVLAVEARLDAFKRSFQALRPGGLLFLDLPNLLRILMEYAGPTEHLSSIEGRSVRLIRHHEVDYHEATFTTKEECIFIDEQGEEKYLQKDHPYAIVSYPELAYLLHTAGFDKIKTFRSYDEREPSAIGRGRMLIVAVKPS